MEQKPTVVIVGRTNVGKSTLFNRLVEQQKSLVSAIPGTTRDRFEADVIWRGKAIRLIDTGGMDIDKSKAIEHHIVDQAERAIKEADVLLFVTDAQTGMQPEDREIAKTLQGVNVPVLTVANKADNEDLQDTVQEWKQLPFGMPFVISARHGIGTGDLLDAAYDELEKVGKPAVEIRKTTSIRVSVIGRPNVGKSTLLNQLVGDERFIASAKEHTTRSPNDTLVEYQGQLYTLVDTAGIRKLAKVRAGSSKLEQKGVDKSVTTMKRSDVVLFVLDISKRIHMQDKFLAGQIEEAGASAIIIANKWDLIPDKDTNTIKEYERYIRAHIPSLSYAPIIFTSAKTGQRVENLFGMINTVYNARFTELSTQETREFISRTIAKHKPSRGRGVSHPKIKFFVQTAVNPPTFKLGLKQQRKDVLAESYVRFIKNQLRSIYEFPGTPIRIHVSARKKSHTT